MRQLEADVQHSIWRACGMKFALFDCTGFRGFEARTITLPSCVGVVKCTAPAVVLTGRQTAGRGRGDHAWWSGKGCLTVTFVMPVHDPALGHRVPLIAGLAVRNAAAEAAGTDAVRLKWPNDLVCTEGTSRSGRLRKLAGLLCERAHGVDLIGLGLNISLDPDSAPENLRGKVASLSQLAGRNLDMTNTLIAITRRLYRAALGGF